jgi:hypothetical protein
MAEGDRTGAVQGGEADVRADEGASETAQGVPQEGALPRIIGFEYGSIVTTQGTFRVVADFSNTRRLSEDQMTTIRALVVAAYVYASGQPMEEIEALVRADPGWRNIEAC